MQLRGFISLLGLALVTSVTSRPYPGTLASGTLHEPKDLIDHRGSLPLLPQEVFDMITTNTSCGDLWALAHASKNMYNMVMNCPQLRRFLKLGPLLDKDQVDLSVVKQFLPVQLESALIKSAWKWDYVDVQHALSFFNENQTAVNEQFAADASSLLKKERLVTIESEWDYINYTLMTESQLKAVFPLLRIIPHMPADIIAQVYKTLIDCTLNPAKVTEGFDICQDQQSSSIQGGFRKQRCNNFQPILVEELLVSISAVLAVTNQIATLKELGIKLNDLRDPIQRPLHGYIALLVLEYGGAEHQGWAFAQVIQRSVTKGIAELFGFQNAIRLLPDEDNTSNLELMTAYRRLSADAYVYAHRSPRHAPALAIRVRRLSVDRLLHGAGLSAPDSIWLPRTNVSQLLQPVDMIVSDWLIPQANPQFA
ncbi:hypothetical protein H4R33_002009 [Dimargaris cristalligena]|nr:hypothetical protein H4R33_002009 [Dimargaris cristalligena]